MEFIIELHGRFGERFSLKKDCKSWISNDINKPVDYYFITSNIYDIIKLQKSDYNISIEGTEWVISPSMSFLSDTNILHYEIKTKRSLYPKMPSKEQLRSVIKQGDDNFLNCLILNIFGFFELRHFHNMDIRVSDPTIVLRHESFCPGNDFVGEEASLDNDHINKYYCSSLEYWLQHLTTGRVVYYSDSHSSDSESSLIAKIESLKSSFED